MAKIIRNESGSTAQIINRDIDDGDSYDVPPSMWADLTQDTALHALVSSGDYVVNDGTDDLSAADGVAHLVSFTGTSWADDVKFDNSSNDFDSDNTHDAIEEARTNSIITSDTVTGSSTASTTSSTYSLISGMTITPPAGKYLVLFSCSAATTSVNGTGDVALFSGGSEVTDTARRVACETAILGLITLSTILIAAPINTQAIVTVDGSQAIEAKFRENDNDTFQIGSRRLTILKIGVA